MSIGQFQQLLGYLFRETYKGDTLIQANILELGWAVERLLKNGRITVYDDYEDNKQLIFDEMEWSSRWD
ncbi:hypothetical protein EUA50_06595 [Staphylococcus saprophyticus]|uniref:hypothetical protein n=1 Tax=Staphylococcus saprophyticus TaxID=29385 RepID=UPI0010139F54|nr:hypothetical protein [Staphylococcus saprophyticus]MDW4446250.1 hypothetical protein [Staphylococcus saprophyticus]RXS10133.1 hypothetical protein EUA50_06595 [Staphylococcus saprophyticus]